MRIVIDTEKNVIICPKTFFEEVAKKNAILKEVGQKPVNHKAEVTKYFNNAIQGELVRQQDVKKR